MQRYAQNGNHMSVVVFSSECVHVLEMAVR